MYIIDVREKENTKQLESKMNKITLFIGLNDKDSNRENHYMGGYCNLKASTNGGKCAEFIGPRSYAYMHPMEVIIETSETYVTEYSTVRKDLMYTAEKFLEFIMEKFEDIKNVGGRITLKSYTFDMDRPEKTVKAINND